MHPLSVLYLCPSPGIREHRADVEFSMSITDSGSHSPFLLYFFASGEPTQVTNRDRPRRAKQAEPSPMEATFPPRERPSQQALSLTNAVYTTSLCLWEDISCITGMGKGYENAS